MSDQIQPDGCNGPFGDARNCPVHGPRMPHRPDPRDAELATLRAENERLNAENDQALREEQARADGIMEVDACRVIVAGRDKQIRELQADLKSNAAMLAKQCDLARAAERRESTLRAGVTTKE